VLPARLRHRVDAIARTVDRGPDNTQSNAPDPEVDPAVLGDVAQAIRREELLRFGHLDQVHLVEPYRLVSWQRRWYLVARDDTTRRWATFRLDRMTPRAPTGRRFRPEPLPEHDYDAFVVREVASSGWAVHARITVAAPAPEVLARINPAVGVVEPVDEHTSVLVTGADSVETIAAYIGMLGLDFEVGGPPDLVDALRVMSRRYAAAVDRPAAGV
jgi:predicted DNA-binding transcriptional regulator YafY